MIKLFKNLRKDKSGAALIETAFVLPLFIFMTLAIFELAIIFFYGFVLESAMYGVTRFAKVQINPQEVQAEVRRQIGERSFGLMDPNKVIITTELNVNFAEEWSNGAAERCESPNETQTCATLSRCDGAWNDRNNNGLCDIGPPPLQLGAPGAIISYVAFYKKEIFTPGLSIFVGGDDDNFLNSNVGRDQSTHLISSATVSRNEPQG